MKAVFPGKPQAKLHAVSTCQWDGRRLVAYVSGTSLLILGGPNELLQTISHADHEALTAVAIHDVSGKIATCTATTIYLYKPFGQDVGVLEWSLQHTYETARGDSLISCLSWGTSEELLVGGAYLTLFSTDQRPRESWSRPLANAAKYTALCPDASIIATTGWHDRLVKIWKRSWFGEDDERFDISYLPHPAVVTGMRWHGRQDAERHTEAILYTTCADNKLRVWAHTDPHDLQTLQTWAEIDLIPCLDSDSIKRYVVIVDNWEFEALVERAAQQGSGDENVLKSLKNLMDISYRDPDICFILDDRGNMSAWGLERVGCKARPADHLFNLAYGGKLDIHFVNACAEEDHLTSCSFGDLDSGYNLNFLLNFFDGRLEWIRCPISHVFDGSNVPSQFTVEATWTGHADVVDKLVKSGTDSAAMSLSSHGEVVLWRQNYRGSAEVLTRSSLGKVMDTISHVVLLNGGTRAVFLHEAEVSLWDFGQHLATELGRCQASCNGGTMGFFQIPILGPEFSESAYVAILTDTGDGVVWQISHSPAGQLSSVEEFCTFRVELLENTSALTIIQKGLETVYFAVLSSTSGCVDAMSIKLDVDEKKVDLTWRTELSTDIQNPSIVAAGANQKVALVDSSGTALTLWDCRDGQLELTEQFESHQNIQLVKWMIDDCGNSAFVVGIPHKLIIYGQQRYDYLNRQPAWARLRLIDVSHVSNLYVADCTWLGSGDLLVAAGNQMFLYGSLTEIPHAVTEDLALPSKASQQPLHSILSALSTEHQVYHPAFLAQCTAVGKVDLVHRILLTLHKVLKFYTEGDDLASDLGLDVSEITRGKDMINGQTKDTNGAYSHDSDDEEANTVTEDIATALVAKLSETKLPFMKNEDQGYLISQVESLGFVERHQRSVDSFGIGYLFFLRNRALRLDHANAVVDPLSWREIVWAFHSNTEDILVDLTSRQYNGRMMWADARDSGMFMWMTDITALRAQFEIIARNEYSKTESRNPIDCSLHYLALKKKTVLIGLWRMATWHREQAATQRLLSNNFADQRWKTAALKNAYALLGRRRFEYAAAFFLLADHLKDAVGVLATQLGDIQLAIAVARVYEGDDGPTLQFLLQDKVIPQALQDGNPWLAHWAFSMLRDSESAMRCLLTPLPALIPAPPKSPLPAQQAKYYSNTDPALLSLYATLRDSPQTAANIKYPTTAVTPLEEWNAVIRTARLYARSGCSRLAVDTLRTHALPSPTLPKPRENQNGTAAADTDGLTNLDGATDGAADEDADGDDEADGEGEKEKKPEMKLGLLDPGAVRKTVVAEPSAASIFDSFDF